jgi:hypothetical protein
VLFQELVSRAMHPGARALDEELAGEERRLEAILDVL